MKTYSDFGISIPPNKSTGEYATTCPKCSHDRSKKNAKCLGVNLDKQVWHCNHCDWRGALPTRPLYEPTKAYTRPTWHNNTTLSDNVVKWFEGRGIRQEVLKEMKVSQGKEWMPQTQKEEHTIQFNYFRNGELINTKFRTGAKHFKMVKDAELILYNFDAIEGQDKIFIVEGEMDCLSFIHAGIKNVVSVPNGATTGKINTDYLNSAIDALNTVGTIILATDNDEAGRNLQKQLMERLGFERCKYLDFGRYKDMNEVLQAEGIQGVMATANNVKEFPIVGSFGIADLYENAMDLFNNGLPTGEPTGMVRFDDHVRFLPGYLTTITGTPGSGKSDFLDQLILMLNWKCMYFSPENRPTEIHIAKLARKLTAKGMYGYEKMSREDYQMALEYLKDKVFFFEPDENYTLDSVLQRAREHRKRFGIDCYVIDAWNKLEHTFEGSETNYISRALDKITMFNQQNGLHCFLVAHPKQMGRTKDNKTIVPSLYDISGSAHFNNKTDIGIVVDRDFANVKTNIVVAKVKFSHWGKVGTVEMSYEPTSGRFYEFGDSNKAKMPWINLNVQPTLMNEIYDNEEPPY
jgi:twinkle protein